jgi:hypothetical protein
MTTHGGGGGGRIKALPIVNHGPRVLKTVPRTLYPEHVWPGLERKYLATPTRGSNTRPPSRYTKHALEAQQT